MRSRFSPLILALALIAAWQIGVRADSSIGRVALDTGSTIGGQSVVTSSRSWDASAGVALVGTTTHAELAVRGMHHVLQFDDTSDESILLRGVMPSSYAGGTVSIFIHWSAATATTGDVTWSGQWNRMDAAAYDLDAADFDDPQSATSTTAGTSGQLAVTQIDFTQTQADEIAANEGFVLMIVREAPDDTDTLTGDAEIARVQMRP